VGAWLSDAEQASLVDRLRAGDADAENEFVALFGGRLRLMIASRVGDREEARDLAQDALLAALRSLRAGQLRDAERLAAFVYGVGRNVANNYLRRRQSAPAEVPLDENEHESASVVVQFEAQQQRALAARALAALEGDDREILSLTLVDGLKPAAIARHLGLSAETVRTRKSRALKRVVAEVARLTRSRGDSH
jgi:RNA polymerase sigma-70 factor (ECF subfamily)